MNPRKCTLAVVAFLTVLAALPAQGESPTQKPTLNLTPSAIQMGTFYGGAKVRVEGMVPSGSKVVICIRGPEITEVYNKVGRVGPIWISTGKVAISGVPSLLLVFSSEPVRNCMCRTEMDRCLADPAAIKKQIQIAPRGNADDTVAENFLKLKLQQGSYQLKGGGVRVIMPEQALTATGSVALAAEAGQPMARDTGYTPYVLELAWPKNAAAGTYAVRLHVCRDGQVIESLESPLSVVEVGFPAAVASLARQRPAVYGIISVIVAMLAGFGIDFIASRLFKRRIASH